MLITTFFQKSSQHLLDFIFPPHCVNCKTPDSWLCAKCLAQISFVSQPVCSRCGQSLTPKMIDVCPPCQANQTLRSADGFRAVAKFEDTPIRQAIHFLKYNNHQAVAVTLAQLLADAYNQFQLVADVIVPVPLHPLRYKVRGYNQSELLAKALAQLLNLPVNIQTLQRIRHTEAQVNLDRAARRQNVSGAFGCKNDELKGKRILLIDDVYTTGATLEACAVALKQDRAATVWGLTLARSGPGER